jgi:probable phosphoglycerate mutase
VPAVAVTLHVVRHGESEWNLSRRVQGQTMEVGLTPLGRQQAAAAAEILARRSVSAIITSDQARAVQTAEIIGSRLAIAPVTDRRLREQSLGWMEGLTLDEALRRNADTDWTDPDLKLGDGESTRDVYIRVAELLDELRGPDGDVVLVTHGDTIRVLLALAGDLGPSEVPYGVPPNASISTVVLPDARR